MLAGKETFDGLVERFYTEPASTPKHPPIHRPLIEARGHRCQAFLQLDTVARVQASCLRCVD